MIETQSNDRCMDRKTPRRAKRQTPNIKRQTLRSLDERPQPLAMERAQVVRRDSDAQESFSTLDYREIAHRRQVLGADYPIRAWRGFRSVPREPIATTSR